jgi:hypothetical protein
MADPLNNFQRPIDSDVAQARQAMRSRFSYVSKKRANVWVTAGATLFVVGLVFAFSLTYFGNANKVNYAAGLRGRYGSSVATKPGVTVNGPDSVAMGQVNSYVFSAPVPETVPAQFHIDWGDGSAAEDPTAPTQTGGFITVQHSYLQIGTFTITAAAHAVNATQDLPAGTLVVHVGSAQGTSANQITVSLDKKNQAGQEIVPGSSAAEFTAVDIAAAADTTVRAITVVARSTAATPALGKFYIYDSATNTLLGSGSLDSAANSSTGRVRISLGAGVTIPAGATAVLSLRADVLDSAPAGTVALGLESVDTNPVSTVNGALPLFGNDMNVNPAAAKPVHVIEGGPARQIQ